MRITPAMQARIDAATRKAQNRIALELEGDMKRHAPVDTGNLRASIRTEENADGVQVGPHGVNYSHYQEFGGGNTHFTPYLRPAVEDVKARR